MMQDQYLWWCCAGNNQKKGSFPGPCGGDRHMILIAYPAYPGSFDPDDFTEDEMIYYGVCSNHKDELIERTT